MSASRRAPHAGSNADERAPAVVQAGLRLRELGQLSDARANPRSRSGPRHRTPANAPVVVIGGGPTGLAAAHALAASGQRVLLLEARPELGGLAGSFELGGFRVDYGPHRLHAAASPEVFTLLRDALGASLQLRARSGLLRIGERSVPYPLSLTGLLRGLGPLELARFTGSLLAARLAPPTGDGYLAEVSRRLGRRAAEQLYGPAARKVFGLDPDALDAAFGRARVRRDGARSLLQAIVAPRSRAGGGRFHYPDGGFGALAEALARRIEARGGELRRGSPVTGLSVERGRVRAVIVDGREVAAERVVATAPLAALCGWTGEGGAADGLSWRALVLVYLVLERHQASRHDVQYLADPALAASRIFEARHFAGGAGPRGRTVLGLDLPCAPGDAVFAASEGELLRRVRPALERAGLAEAPILDVAVRRIGAAYPVYRRGYTRLRDGALDALGRIEGLYPVGRHALFVHDNVHHACAAGLAAGRAAADALSAAAWRERARAFAFAEVED